MHLHAALCGQTQRTQVTFDFLVPSELSMKSKANLLPNFIWLQLMCIIADVVPGLSKFEIILMHDDISEVCCGFEWFYQSSLTAAVYTKHWIIYLQDDHGYTGCVLRVAFNLPPAPFVRLLCLVVQWEKYYLFLLHLLWYCQYCACVCVHLPYAVQVLTRWYSIKSLSLKASLNPLFPYTCLVSIAPFESLVP